MMMPMLAMDMAMRYLFRSRHANSRHGAGEQERDAGQRVIAINDDLVIGDVGNGKQTILALAILGAALELHADFNVFREQLARFNRYQVRVVFTKRVFRLQLDFQLITDCLALQFLLDAVEYAPIAAMQIDQRVGAFVDRSPLRVAHAVVESDDGIPSDEHGAFLCH